MRRSTAGSPPWLRVATYVNVAKNDVGVAIHKKSHMNFKKSVASVSLALCLSFSASAGFAATFASTNDASAWQVSTNLSGVDGALASFSTTNFQPAVTLSGRLSGTTNWIANNSTGTNSCCTGDWKFFVFRQTFFLTAAEAASGSLKFQWAADDSGEGFAERGSWVPKYSLNGGSLINGVWATGATYDLGPTVDLTTGFVAGINTIDFYVEGNGVTDGFALKTDGFTAPVPEPETCVLMLAGLAATGFMVRRRKQ